MIRSLRARLFLVAAIVIVAALGAVALLSRQAAYMEFHRFEVVERAAQVENAAHELSRRLGDEPDSARITAVLEEMSRSVRRRLLLIAPDGRVLGATTPELRLARVHVGPGEQIGIDVAARVGARPVTFRAIIAGGPRGAVMRPSGDMLGTLLVLPLDDGAPSAPRAFGVAFDLRLWIAALASGLVALALTWWLSRRILEPVAELTRAARRLGGGDLSSRVPVRSADEVGELSRAFNAMAEDLARQESLRRNLVSDVAHELRTPLTNLRCQIEAVEDGLLPASADTVRSLREEVLLLSRLVEDLQTLAVAEAGRLSLERGPVAPRELVEGALEGFRAQAAARGLTLTHSIPELPPVNVDATRIGQVLRNLLTNAAAATPEGGTIEVSARADAGSVEIRVRDTGRGIAPEHLARVFERFYRVDPSRARSTGGAGLGLAIVKGIVEAHGGTVTAESEPGHGATFRITLPRAQAPPLPLHHSFIRSG